VLGVLELDRLGPNAVDSRERIALPDGQLDECEHDPIALGAVLPLPAHVDGNHRAQGNELLLAQRSCRRRAPVATAITMSFSFTRNLALSRSSRANGTLRVNSVRCERMGRLR
jgi:hypothetical protein